VPLSLTTASQYWNVESFEFWDPISDTFGPGVQGRMRRVDPFVSLWHKASRRGNIHFVPGTDVSGVSVIRHPLSGLIFLLSHTAEVNAWQNEPAYNEMHRVHKAVPPSGGKGLYLPVTVSGSGDDLGPITMGPPQIVYLDVERSGLEVPEHTVNVKLGAFYIACSRVYSPRSGDVLSLDGKEYMVYQWFWDTGFLYAAVVEGSPKYITVTFRLEDANSPVFDPSTGRLTTGNYVERQVSAQVGSATISGMPSDRDVKDKQVIFIYTGHIGFKPTVGQQVVIDGRVRSIVRVAYSDEQAQFELEIST
jgi:hypothetical protein